MLLLNFSTHMPILLWQQTTVKYISHYYTPKIDNQKTIVCGRSVHLSISSLMRVVYHFWRATALRCIVVLRIVQSCERDLIRDIPLVQHWRAVRLNSKLLPTLIIPAVLINYALVTIIIIRLAQLYIKCKSFSVYIIHTYISLKWQQI